jgi:hypothetical protein
MLTVHATLRRQRRNILDFMRAACTAALRSHPAPSLLPIEASVIPLVPRSRSLARVGQTSGPAARAATPARN